MAIPRLVIIATLFLYPGAALAEVKAPLPLSCVAEMTMPVYPALPRQARIMGTVHAELTVSEGGVAKDIVVTAKDSNVKSARPLLTKPVEEWLKRTKFQPACARAKLEFVFVFRLEEVARRTRYEAPNRFVVIARPIPIGGA